VALGIPAWVIRCISGFHNTKVLVCIICLSIMQSERFCFIKNYLTDFSIWKVFFNGKISYGLSNLEGFFFFLENYLIDYSIWKVFFFFYEKISYGLPNVEGFFL